MTSSETTEGRSIKKMVAVGATLAVAGASLLLLTEFPPGLASGAGASTALAELAARSPGARIGGIALKAKTRRASPRSLARGAMPAGGAAPPALGAPIASVMSAGPAGPLGAAPAGLGSFPGDLILPATTVVPGSSAVVAPAPGGGVGFVPGPGGGGVIIGAPPGGGGTPGATTPTPTPTPTVTPPVVVPTPNPTTPPVAAIPEPATWAMLIAGFGFVGGRLRRRRHVRRLA